MDSILGQILDQPAWLVYLIVGLVVFVEDALFVGFVVPGETVAVLGGVTASLGTTNVWLIGLIVVAAAVLGDSVGYEIGRVWGTQIIARPFFDKRRQRLDQARAFLRELTHILQAIFSALLRRESPYASVLAAVLELAGEKAQAVNIPDEPTLDESWEEPAAFGGCSTQGQASPGQPQPIQIVRAAARQASTQPGASA